MKIKREKHGEILEVKVEVEKEEQGEAVWVAPPLLLISCFNERCKPADRFLIFQAAAQPGVAPGWAGLGWG